MNVNNVFLEKVGTQLSQYPTSGLMEIAFVGKSNVGKSSLINAMVNRKALARTSQNPGKTRTINFYNVEEQMYFVDLPGYGYAKLSKSESEKWGKMIEIYLKKREELKSIIFLIDIRHEPGKNDLQMYEWLKYYNYQIIVVCTKSDKISRNQVTKHVNIIKKSLGLTPNDIIMPFSSEKKIGKEELWEVIDKLRVEYDKEVVESNENIAIE